MVASDRGRVAAHIPQTNNTAEYTAIVKALEGARSCGLRLSEVRSDSRLAVNSITGRWKTKAAHLRPLRDRARELLGDIRLRWIPREQNERADALTSEDAEAVGDRGEPDRSPITGRATEYHPPRCPRCGYVGLERAPLLGEGAS